MYLQYHTEKGHYPNNLLNIILLVVLLELSKSKLFVSSQYKDVYIWFSIYFNPKRYDSAPSRSKTVSGKKFFFIILRYSDMIQNRKKSEIYKEWISPQHCLATISVNTMFCCPLWKSFWNGCISDLPKYVFIFFK